MMLNFPEIVPRNVCGWGLRDDEKDLNANILKNQGGGCGRGILPPRITFRTFGC